MTKKKDILNQRKNVERLRKIIEQIIHQNLSDAELMISEIECNDPACVPIETLLVFFGVHSRWITKILKPLKDIQSDDILNLNISEHLKEINQDKKKIVPPILLKLESELIKIYDPYERLNFLHEVSSLVSGLQDACRSEILKMETNHLPNNDREKSEISPIMSTSSSSIPTTIVKINSPNMNIDKFKQNHVSLKSNVSSAVPTSGADRHLKGVRQRGCPCCDPDNIDNIVDSMMFFKPPI